MSENLIRRFIKESILQEKIRTQKGVKSIAGERFSFNRFKNLGTRQAMLSYASIFLNEIGGGSLEETGTSRKAFLFSGNKVLKVARNEAGVAQNEAEVKISQNAKKYGGSAVTKIYDWDPEFKWLTADTVKVNKLDSENTFYRLAGLSFELFKDIISSAKNASEAMKLAYDEKSNPPEDPIKTESEWYEDYRRRSKASQFMKNIVRLVIENDMMLGDVLKLDHWGVLNDKLMLLDYGFTFDVFEKYYKGKVVLPEDLFGEPGAKPSTKPAKPEVPEAFKDVGLKSSDDEATRPGGRARNDYATLPSR